MTRPGWVFSYGQHGQFCKQARRSDTAKHVNLDAPYRQSAFGEILFGINN